MAPEDSAALDEWPTAGQAATDGGEAVRASEQQFRREFGLAPVGMVVTSLDVGRQSVYLAVNDAYCQLTGCSRRELAGANFLGDFHPEQQPALEALLQKVISGETGQIRADTRLVHKNSEIVCVRLTGSAIQPDTGDRYLATYVEDTTAAEQAQAELRRLEHELLRSRRLDSLGQLAGGIAHDFNNMLTVITNYASLVRDEVTVAEAADSATRWGPVRWDIEQIEGAADRAKRLIKHLLAFAQREQAQPAPVDLSRLINDVTGLLREVLGEHVTVITRQGEGLWPVEADPGLLEQAIINIALNARDAMPAGGHLTIDTANIDTVNPGAAGPAAQREDPADLAELLPGHYVTVRITDTGAGMDAITAERAFEPFFTTKPADQAAGLGLPAVRRIATQAGGKAWLRSEPGRGTTITITLPAAPGSAATGPSASHPGRLTEHAGAVLVVDDEPSIRDVAHRVLTYAGYRVTTAADGKEALRLLRDPGTPADLVLTDVVMPGIAGNAFATQAQEIRPGIQVLYMSGYEQQTTTQSWPQPGTPVIAKPFSRAALLARVTQALAAGISAGGGEQLPQPVRAEHH